MPTLGLVSRNNLKGVHPRLIQLVEMAIVATPIDFRVTDGLRTLEEQQHYVDIGASHTLESKHLTGRAVDLVPWINGKPRWEWPLIYSMAEHIRQCAKELDIAIKWGGAWNLSMSFTYTVKPIEDLVKSYIKAMKAKGRKPFVDGPHFELCTKEV